MPSCQIICKGQQKTSRFSIGGETGWTGCWADTADSGAVLLEGMGPLSGVPCWINAFLHLLLSIYRPKIPCQQKISALSINPLQVISDNQTDTLFFLLGQFSVSLNDGDFFLVWNSHIFHHAGIGLFGMANQIINAHAEVVR